MSVYQTYLAVKLHFEGKYDYFKYNGRLPNARGCPPGTAFIEEKLARYKDDLPLFFAANMVRKPGIWYGDLWKKPSEEVFNAVKGWIESASYSYQKEFSQYISPLGTSWGKAIIGEDGAIPSLMKATPEFAVSFDLAVVRYLEWWTNNERVNSMVQERAKVLMRYQPFIKPIIKGSSKWPEIREQGRSLTSGNPK